MYQIAICEDEKIFSESQKKICTDIFIKNNIEYHIDIFENSSQFLSSFLIKQQNYDLILLDIIMDGLNGMELAGEIRKHDNEATIIFITSTRDFALQGYDVNALHYLIKPVNTVELERLILLDYRKKFLNNYLVFKSGTQNIRIPVKNIICAETVGRRVEITLTDKTVYYPGRLAELLEKLPANQFVQCHKAFLINLHNTSELTRLSAISINNIETPISRTFAKDVQKAFLKSIHEN